MYFEKGKTLLVQSQNEIKMHKINTFQYRVNCIFERGKEKSNNSISRRE